MMLDMWENVPVELLKGRSDYQIVRDIPKTVRSDKKAFQNDL